MVACGVTSPRDSTVARVFLFVGHNCTKIVSTAVFQITFKGRVSIRRFEGSIDVSLPTPSKVSYFILSGQVASFLGFLTWNPSVIWNTGTVLTQNAPPKERGKHQTLIFSRDRKQRRFHGRT